jgi:hypothetical protein
VLLLRLVAAVLVAVVLEEMEQVVLELQELLTQVAAVAVEVVLQIKQVLLEVQVL